MSLIELASSALAGNLLGAAGAALARWQQGKAETEQTKLRQEHEIKLAQLELQQAKAMKATQVIRAEADVQVASYTADSATEAGLERGSFVANVRALVRPALTAFLVLVTASLSLTIASGAQLEPADQTALLYELVDGLVGSTGMALAWWFGARNAVR